MQTLLDLLPRFRDLGDREAVRYFNGYRTWILSYRDLYRRTAALNRQLRERGLGKGDRLLLWGENRPEWLVAFWAAVASGVELVPVDYRASTDLAERIQREVGAKLVVRGPSTPREACLDAPVLTFQEIAALVGDDSLEITPVFPSDVAEIVYTSGTTGEPKGLVHRHRNLCANLTPFDQEIAKYRTYAAPFQPIRILDLLPLSHLFGQSLGAFIPLMLGGAVVFLQDLHPTAILETIRRERVSVLVSVPRLLENLRSAIERRFEPPPSPSATGLLGAALRWWRYRSIHAAFGWKFWAVLVGGARLADEEEDFWRQLGFVVVQGYGLTEASPVVAVNHPFHPTRGSLGKAVSGQEVKLAPDGEILVRGPSVVSEYFGKRPGGEEASDEGWLHTGDLGRMDEEGRLYFLGRKKDVIVTGEGLNVHPQDVEAELDRCPEVEESVVVGLPVRDQEQVHAVLRLAEPEVDVGRLVGRVNEKLERHQRIRGWTLWPLEEDFPRTSSTYKVRRGEIRRRVLQMRKGDEEIPEEARPSGLIGVLAEMTGRPAGEIDPHSRLEEDLGLSSLDRLDLLSRLEDAYGVALDDDTLATIATVEELSRTLTPVGTGDERAAEHLEPPKPSAPPSPAVSPLEGLPRWSRHAPIRWLRAAFLETVTFPLFRRYLDLHVEGLGELDRLEPPILLAANHNSHLDTLAIMAGLPRSWRHRIAPAMSPDFFRAYLEPEGAPWRQRAIKAVQYWMACALVNAYPLPQRTRGTRDALKFTGELAQSGYCPLVYPEGERSPDGRMLPFKPGIGLMAVRLRLPVVPVGLQGLFEIYSMHDSWPNTGSIRMKIGEPLRFAEDEDYETVTRVIEQTIAELAETEAPPVGKPPTRTARVEVADHRT